MNKTVYEEGLEHGRFESLEQYRRTLIQVLEARFGSFPEGLSEKVKALSWDEITRLMVTCQKVTSMEDLGLV